LSAIAEIRSRCRRPRGVGGAQHHRRAESLARPRFLQRKRRASSSTGAKKKSPSSRGACRGRPSTILFGQSGLGKTSILRAGIVPRLRREGYCPGVRAHRLRARIAVASQQIKQAIFRATEGAGRWTQPGIAVAGESLWEFLHHRDDLLERRAGPRRSRRC
jgi:hypothetical protein